MASCVAGLGGTEGVGVVGVGIGVVGVGVGVGPGLKDSRVTS